MRSTSSARDSLKTLRKRPGLVQVAGIHDAEEARAAIACGVRWLGFPLRLPVHAEDLTEAEAAEVIHGLPEGVHAVLITYLDRAPDILAFCRTLGVSAVQLHGDISAQEVESLRTAAPELALIKSLVVGLHANETLFGEAKTLSPWVDAFITDTFDPSTGASGATGRTHDWAISRKVVEQSPRPVILAGGLTPENVAGAVREVRPAGVDVHTGVEDASGRKCPKLLGRFMDEVRLGYAPD